MSKITLYIAASLDGYIARENGDLDWLHSDNDYGYEEFIKSIGITLMGNNTYKQLLTFGDFPYSDKENYVFTTNVNLLKDDNVTYISGDIAGFTKLLKDTSKKDIWLVGGSKINDLLVGAGIVDELILFIMPVIIGCGIPLFSNSNTDQYLKLMECQSYSDGMVQLKYKFVKR